MYIQTLDKLFTAAEEDPMGPESLASLKTHAMYIHTYILIC